MNQQQREVVEALARYYRCSTQQSASEHYPPTALQPYPQPWHAPPPPTRQQLDDYPPQQRHDYDDGYPTREHHERTKKVTIDPNSSLIKGRQLQFDSDGRVDPNCPAVRDGDVLINKDGTIDQRSKALKKPALQFKKH